MERKIANGVVILQNLAYKVAEKIAAHLCFN